MATPPTLFATAMAVALASGCLATSGVASDGRHWVRLSTADNLLPELESYAHEAGCRLARHTDAGDDDFGSLTIRCSAGSLVVSQRHDVLSYRCRDLRGEACDALMLELTPRCRPQPHTARRARRGNALAH